MLNFFQIKQKLDDILERLPEEFNLRELMAKAEEKTPYTVVAIQECERMNMLTREIRRSLKELNLGLKVQENQIKSLFIVKKNYKTIKLFREN